MAWLGLAADKIAQRDNNCYCAAADSGDFHTGVDQVFVMSDPPHLETAAVDSAAVDSAAEHPVAMMLAPSDAFLFLTLL